MLRTFVAEPMLMSESLPSPAAEVDARGLACPLPLLKAKLALNALENGAVLKILATDAGSQRDLNAFARLAGHRMLAERLEDGVYHYWLCKGTGA
jgi:TusA-related sulfurtransferase